MRYSSFLFFHRAVRNDDLKCYFVALHYLLSFLIPSWIVIEIEIVEKSQFVRTDDNKRNTVIITTALILYRKQSIRNAHNFIGLCVHVHSARHTNTRDDSSPPRVHDKRVECQVL